MTSAPSLDQGLVGRTFAPAAPYEVTAGKVREFVVATGGRPDDDRAPATFPIVLAFEAMTAFLDQTGIDLSRIVHGEQSFAYERPVAAGDVLSAELVVSSLRQIGGNDIIATTSRITDDTGALVCTTTATLVHRGGAQ